MVSRIVSRLGFIEPQLPTLVEEPPEGDDWIHKVKYDGYRTQIHVDKWGVLTFTRRGLNWTAKYPSIVAAARHLSCKSAILHRLPG